MTDPTFSAFPSEKKLLSELLSESPGTVAVEIGCLLGSTSVVLAAAARLAGKKVWCLDCWDGTQDGSGEDNYNRFLEVTAPLADVITVYRGRSQTIPLPDADVGFVFIDGDHSRDGCLGDLRRFWPLLTPGGVLTVHDAFDVGWGPGIRDAIDTFCRELGPVTVTHSVYYPDATEAATHRHGVSGVSIIRKL